MASYSGFSEDERRAKSNVRIGRDEHMTEGPPRDPWIDEEASEQLPILRAQGEGQTLEYMKSFPENARDLAKEIAAFATSNSGTILIGVDNDGACVGIPAVTPAQRDGLLRRIEGICNGVIKPAITPSPKFARDGTHTVLTLTVPKGSQPIYYANNIPYVRHITSSRPAEPHEVIELIQGTVRPRFQVTATESVEEVPDKRTLFLADLMRDLASVVIFGEELEHRVVNPWLELVRAQFGNVASRLREAAAEQVAVDEKLELPLLDAAEALDHFAKLRLHLGSGDDLSASATLAVTKAKDLLERIGPEVIAHVPTRQLVDQLAVIRRELTALRIQADKAPESGSIQDIQTRSAVLGLKLLNIANYGVNRLAPNLHSALLSAGHQLHLSETERLYLDGGTSVARIIDNLKKAIDQFDAATQSVLPPGRAVLVPAA
jgi:ATP-dependent DNA helicase RecG